MQSYKQARIKAIFLGGPGNGKTYFLKKYLYNQENPVLQQSIIGVEYGQTSIRLNQSQNLTVATSDFTGPVKYCSLVGLKIKKQQKPAFIIFTDVSSNEYLRTIGGYVKFIKQHSHNTDNIRILILGNKIDLIDQSQRLNIIDRIKNTYLKMDNCKFQLISCKGNFERAKIIVQAFIKQCYQQNYQQQIRQHRFKVQKVLDYVNNLGCSSLNNQWFQDQNKRNTVQQYFKVRLKKRQNIEEVMVLGLLVHQIKTSLIYLDSQIESLRQRQANNKQQLINHEKEEPITQITQNQKRQYQKQILKLRQKLIEYEYWIVEADRLHYSVTQAINNSPFKEKFAQFRRTADEVNSRLEEEMSMWQVHDNGYNLGGSFIQSGISFQNKPQKIVRVEKRMSLQRKLQMLEQIIEEYNPPFQTK